MKKVLVLLAALALASCQLIPEIEEYPQYRTPPRPRPSQDETSGDVSGQGEDPSDMPQSNDEAAPEEHDAPGIVDSVEPDTPPEASVYLPEEEPPSEGQIPAELPEAVPPIVEERPPPAPAAQPAAPPPQPPAQAQPAPQPAPPPPPPPPAAQPQQPPAQSQRETPPPPPPITARPSEPAPLPRRERETPSTKIPDMPFKPVPALPEQEIEPPPLQKQPEPPPVELNLPYSRTVRARVGQYVEIPFRGPGWVYLGEYSSRRGVSYDSRRMEQDGMTFVFRADAGGTYSLRFNRQDYVKDNILNDYVKVIVEQLAAGSSQSGSGAKQDRVYASPRWPPAADPVVSAGAGANGSGQAQSGTNPGQAAAAGQGGASSTPQAAAPSAAAAPSTAAPQAVVPSTVPQTAAPSAAAPSTAAASPATGTGNASAVEPVEDWLKKAREEFSAGRIPGALGALDQFMIRFPAGSDEAYWLYGQSLEANNESTRNIRLSLDYYRKLLQEYPQSSRCEDARRRIVFLERFYFSIQ